VCCGSVENPDAHASVYEKSLSKKFERAGLWFKKALKGNSKK
jgi:hypothetical protein